MRLPISSTVCSLEKIMIGQYEENLSFSYAFSFCFSFPFSLWWLWSWGRGYNEKEKKERMLRLEGVVVQASTQLPLKSFPQRTLRQDSGHSLSTSLMSSHLPRHDCLKIKIYYLLKIFTKFFEKILGKYLTPSAPLCSAAGCCMPYVMMVRLWISI